MKVELLEDYGGKSKGTLLELPQSLATAIIKKGKAKVFTEKAKKESKPKEKE